MLPRAEADMCQEPRLWAGFTSGDLQRVQELDLNLYGLLGRQEADALRRPRGRAMARVRDQRQGGHHHRRRHEVARDSTSDFNSF